MLVVKRIAAVLVAGALLVGVSGCGDNAETEKDGSLGGMYSNAGGTVKLSDGRTVMCVAYGKGGVSCDWATAK